MRSIATIIAFFIALAPGLAHGQTEFVVNTTADNVSGAQCTPGGDANEDCTLRQAILEANGVTGDVLISFDIDSGELEDGAYRIRLQTRYNELGNNITIDGTTQDGYADDQKVVVLDGAECTSDPCNALRLTGTDITITGLTIHGFAWLANGDANTTAAVRIVGDDNIVQQNYIGVDYDGSVEADLANRRGVRISGDGNIISRNVISNSVRHGISLRQNPQGDQAAANNTIQNNWIGTDANGDGGLAEGDSPSDSPYGNGFSGVRVRGGAQSNVIKGNTIAYNGYGHPEDTGATTGWPGIWIANEGVDPDDVTLYNQVRRNRVFSNDGLGVDIADSGGDRGDATPSDAETCSESLSDPNQHQCYPVIVNAEIDPNTNDVHVTYRINSPDRALYPMEVEFFMAENGATGAEGMEFVGDDVYTRDNFREESTTVTFSPNFNVDRDDYVVATATNSQGSTSEFSFDPHVIPVEFASFDAQFDGGSVLLSWSTLTESNNAGFQVQMKTDDAESFEDVDGAFVSSQAPGGNSSQMLSYEQRVDDLSPGTYTFRLKQVDFDGVSSYSAEAQAVVPARFELTEAYPNPFQQATQVQLTVPEVQDVTVEVYDVLGRRVATLHEGQVSPEQPLEVTFDGSDLSSGMYLIRVEGETFNEIRQATLVR